MYSTSFVNTHHDVEVDGIVQNIKNWIYPRLEKMPTICHSHLRTLERA